MVQIVLRSEKCRDLILQKVSIELAKKFVCIFLLDIPQNGCSTGDPYNFALFHLKHTHSFTFVSWVEFHTTVFCPYTDWSDFALSVQSEEPFSCDRSVLQLSWAFTFNLRLTSGHE